jgi:hypothetical protein
MTIDRDYYYRLTQSNYIKPILHIDKINHNLKQHNKKNKEKTFEDIIHEYLEDEENESH